MAVKLMPVAAPSPIHDRADPERTEGPVPRKRRKAAVFDAEGNEVLISLMCLKCHTLRPLSMFGLRKMADGAIRNQPWCRVCRGASTAKKKGEAEASPEVAAAPAGVVAAAVPVAPAAAAQPATLAVESPPPAAPSTEAAAPIRAIVAEAQPKPIAVQQELPPPVGSSDPTPAPPTKIE